jgi:hypothetical protein
LTSKRKRLIGNFLYSFGMLTLVILAGGFVMTPGTLRQMQDQSMVSPEGIEEFTILLWVIGAALLAVGVGCIVTGWKMVRRNLSDGA